MKLVKEVRFSCRRGKMVAGYVTLERRAGDWVARSKKITGGLVMDYSEDSRLIGIEIPTPTHASLKTLLKTLNELHYQDPERELQQLREMVGQ